MLMILYKIYIFKRYTFITKFDLSIATIVITIMSYFLNDTFITKFVIYLLQLSLQ